MPRLARLVERAREPAPGARRRTRRGARRARGVEQHEAPAAEVEGARRARLAEQRVAVDVEALEARRSSRGCRGRRGAASELREARRAPPPNCSGRPPSAMSPLITVASTPAALISAIASSFMKRQYGTSVSSARTTASPAPRRRSRRSRSACRRSAARRSGGRSASRSRASRAPRAPAASRRAPGSSGPAPAAPRPRTSIAIAYSVPGASPSMRTCRVPAPSTRARSSPSTRTRAARVDGAGAVLDAEVERELDSVTPKSSGSRMLERHARQPTRARGAQARRPAQVGRRAARRSRAKAGSPSASD